MPLAPDLVFGGPPECPERPYCLKGLTDRYGLTFRAFQPLPSRAATPEALRSGEVRSVCWRRPTPGSRTAAWVLLRDDRRLQPDENVVVLLRQPVVAAHGDRVVHVLDAVSAQLTTADLVRLNSRVELDGLAAEQAAAEWLRVHPDAATTATPARP